MRYLLLCGLISCLALHAGNNGSKQSKKQSKNKNTTEIVWWKVQFQKDRDDDTRFIACIPRPGERATLLSYLSILRDGNQITVPTIRTFNESQLTSFKIIDTDEVVGITIKETTDLFHPELSITWNNSPVHIINTEAYRNYEIYQSYNDSYQNYVENKKGKGQDEKKQKN